MNTTQKTGMQNGAQMRITPEDIAIIKGLFKGNEAALRLMRKIFLPELDPTAPIGQMIDIYGSIPTKDRTVEQIAVDLMARNIMVAHCDAMLMQLQAIANLPEEGATAKVSPKNSAK